MSRLQVTNCEFQNYLNVLYKKNEISQANYMASALDTASLPAFDGFCNGLIDIFRAIASNYFSPHWHRSKTN